MRSILFLVIIQQFNSVHFCLIKFLNNHLTFPFTGATVSTRGRFMTEHEKARCPHERPLYLYIQGHSKHNIDCKSMLDSQLPFPSSPITC